MRKNNRKEKKIKDWKGENFPETSQTDNKDYFKRAKSGTFL